MKNLFSILLLTVTPFVLAVPVRADNGSNENMNSTGEVFAPELGAGGSIGSSHPGGGVSLHMRAEEYEKGAALKGLFGGNVGVAIEGDAVVDPAQSGGTAVPKASAKALYRAGFKLLWFFDMKGKIEALYDRDVALQRAGQAAVSGAALVGTSSMIEGQPPFKALVGLKGIAGYERRLDEASGGKNLGFALIGPTGEFFFCSGDLKREPAPRPSKYFYYDEQTDSRVCAKFDATAMIGGDYPYGFEKAWDTSAALYYERVLTAKADRLFHTVSIGPEFKGEGVCGRGDVCAHSVTGYLNLIFR